VYWSATATMTQKLSELVTYRPRKRSLQYTIIAIQSAGRVIIVIRY
jgi:hypothetical protein